MSTDLMGPEIAGKTLTFFALGGSGIRAIEPLLFLCAFGLGPRQLRLVLIDPDQSNAAVRRSRELVELYRSTRAALVRAGATDGYFRTEVLEAVGSALVWSPIADDEGLPDARFSARVDRSLMNGRGAALGQLFDLLNADRIRGMDMTMGFRGVPSIGTVFMNRLREEPFFAHLLSGAQGDATSVFFAVGSIFGGTGSAAFPVVGRALSDSLPGSDGAAGIAGISQARIGGALLLPYFTLPDAGTALAADGGPRPQNALFAQNAAGALPTYFTRDVGYGGLYVLGDDQPRAQLTNEVGGERQANAAHYVELFAALAALDFTARGGEAAGARFPVFHSTAVESSHLGWNDLPISAESRNRLMGGVVAAHTFLTAFRPGGGAHPELEAKLLGVTWMRLLKLEPRELLAKSELLDGMGRFFRAAWTWLAELRGSDPALALVSKVDNPLALRPDALIAGRGTAGSAGRERHDEYDVFRHWNHAAYDRRATGIAGFMEVMREGSERYSRAAHAENIDLRGAA